MAKRQTPKIESYRFGNIVVDGQPLQKDVILLPDRVVEGWWRQEGHTLRSEDLQAVFEAAPEVLVVGRGTFARMRIPQEVEQALQAAGIELIALPTGQAVEAYNRLRQERPTAAALHLSC